MDHTAVLSNNPDGFARPVHVQCSCNTAGDFDTEQQASDWITLVHFARRGPTENCELSSTLSSAPTPPPASALASPPESQAGVAAVETPQVVPE